MALNIFGKVRSPWDGLKVTIGVRVTVKSQAQQSRRDVIFVTGDTRCANKRERVNHKVIVVHMLTSITNVRRRNNIFFAQPDEKNWRSLLQKNRSLNVDAGNLLDDDITITVRRDLLRRNNPEGM
jgi:hypothetical protein